MGPPQWDRGVTRICAAEMLDYDYSTVCRMVRDGELETYGEGKKLRIYESSIARYRQNTHNKNRKDQAVQDRPVRATARHRDAMQTLEQLLGR